MDARSPTSASEKAEVEKIQDVAAPHTLGKTGTETASDPAIGSFVDIDEQKVLRKVRHLSNKENKQTNQLTISPSLTGDWCRWIFD